MPAKNFLEILGFAIFRNRRRALNSRDEMPNSLTDAAFHFSTTFPCSSDKPQIPSGLFGFFLILPQHICDLPEHHPEFQLSAHFHPRTSSQHICGTLFFLQLSFGMSLDAHFFLLERVALSIPASVPKSCLSSLAGQGTAKTDPGCSRGRFLLTSDQPSCELPPHYRHHIDPKIPLSTAGWMIS